MQERIGRIMKSTRIIALLLALLTASSVGCGESADTNETTDNTTAASTSDETTSDAPELPDEDYEGYNFRILTRIEGWGIYNNENLVVEEENGEILNDAIYTRNRTVEERFNINLTQITTTNDIANEIKTTVMAGDDAYDLTVSTYQMNLGSEYFVDFKIGRAHV